jgi:hypothetical protein
MSEKEPKKKEGTEEEQTLTEDQLEGVAGGADTVAMPSLDGSAKMGNFEIQDLMSQYNQAETLSSSMAKKKKAG